MDPLTAIGLAANIQQLLTGLFQYAKDAWNARTEIRQLSAEVAILKATLEHIRVILVPSRERHEFAEDAKQLLFTENFVADEFPKMVSSTEDLLKEILDNLQAETSKGRLSQMGKQVWQRATWHLSKKEAKDYMERVERAKSWFILVLTTDDTIRCQEMYLKICHIEQAMRNQESRQEDQKLRDMRKAIISWLRAYDPYSKYIQSFDYFQKDTGKWFLNGIYQEWMEGEHHSMLWFKAKPGFGKTTLMAAAVAQALEFQDREAGPGTLYFFCSFTEEDSQITDHILGSLIVQICEYHPALWQDIEDEYHPFADQESNRSKRLKTQDLMDLLTRLIEKAGHVRIFIDAINEAKEPEVIVEQFVELIQRTQSVRILLSSTEETAFHVLDSEARKGVTFVFIRRNANSEDIVSYILARIEQSKRLRQLPESLKSEILVSLQKRSDGMFRWVQCQLDSLAGGKKARTIKEIRMALQSLPEGLEQTYEQTLRRIIEDGDADLARPALFWLCFCQRPMTFEELCEAVTIPDDSSDFGEDTHLQLPNDLLEVCGSLISYTPTTHGNYLTLGHSSVSVYLTSEALRYSPVRTFYFDNGSANTIMSRLCLSYLLRPQFRAGYCEELSAWIGRKTRYPLLLYVADNLSNHLHYANSDGPLRPLLLRLLGSQDFPHRGNFGALVQAFYKTIRPSQIEKTTALYWASREGLVPLVKMILAVNGRVHLERKGGRNKSTPLHVASWAGHVDVVRVLLNAGASVHATDTGHVNGLFYAMLTGNAEVEQLLRDSGAQLNDDMKDLLDKSRRIYYKYTLRQDQIYLSSGVFKQRED